MNYSEEKVYELVGKDDKVATVYFQTISDSFKIYCPHVTVLFLYTQYEREELDGRVENQNSFTPGIIKVQHLTSQLNEVKISKLEAAGIDTNDIVTIRYLEFENQNTFHSKEKRAIKRVEIPIVIQPKGGDLNWIYGLTKNLVEKGIALSPIEKKCFLAGRLYFEENMLSYNEKIEIYGEDEKMDSIIEFEYLKIKLKREDINDFDLNRLSDLFKVKERNDINLLDRYLKKAGSSLSKLSRENFDSASELFSRITKYRETRINHVGKKAIFLDIAGYLHVYMRHVKEFEINKQFEDKTNFQWYEEDVLMVIDNVINKINDEIQEFFEKNPESRFSRRDIYFEGDYYNVHIAPSGSIGTLHKKEKRV